MANSKAKPKKKCAIALFDGKTGAPRNPKARRMLADSEVIPTYAEVNYGEMELKTAAVMAAGKHNPAASSMVIGVTRLANEKLIAERDELKRILGDKQAEIERLTGQVQAYKAMIQELR